ncbi:MULTISPECIES: tRNA uracil 4-sulfurtransferase ThiI [unclassified Lactococcus]|uniref:tRNA uracil 4-sulfurtransferase ThiI n=1 Tax=unclassified Lactococcus TaxID=2643510 RepID=UPI0011C81702|nr:MULTISPECIES: tRNA uracil 4-sulfurtransferase ThiI [unclassified Lactococcus]MQW22855.1 tRNA 4-thiouridine(8) synthase ThiI [Lactococcus sp. dk101]TXK44596.1 tRNA 4-thiouridine(8) synthase ThiI [Lactococcus sp. dk310]TXK50449.1 tRNA 4-thiouridine(8) synthase ThiI [Lactococcus sp. dk322]
MTVYYDEIMVRYGELSTKGKNRGFFINRLAKNIREVLSDLTELKISAVRDRAHIVLNGTDYAEVSRRLTKVFGIQNFSPSIKVEKTMPAIEAAVADLFKEIYTDGMTFKIAARRADHDFELDSTEINLTLGDVVFDNFDYAKVQMKKPDITLRVEIRQDAAYLSYETIKGAGGMPVGTAGRGHLMLSGGIDSPVAGYLALKRGVEIEAVHFASPPYTSPGALKKAKDLAAKLTVFGGSIQFIEVPFTEIQEEIKAKAPQAYLMTLTRRFMMRVVDKIRENRVGKVIINGESLGQVASQTLGSMSVINEVTNTPVIRPVVTMDKIEIIEIAEKIDTFNLSILPFEDCCTVFAPPAPKTNPKLDNCLQYETRFDVEGLVNRAVEGIMVTTISGENWDTEEVDEFVDFL